MTATTTLSGRYRLEERLGSGGAGYVWRARDEVLHRDVAVKLLHPELERDEATVARLQQEAKTAAVLNHPNAVTLYDIGEEEGRIYLVMELIDGPSLAQFLEAQGALSVEATVAIGLQVAQALGTAHAADLVHRDVKPANILLSQDGRAKVVDFGVARAIGDAHTQLTATGTVVGTAAYLAPEQLQGDGIDARADVYALGLVLHECITGHRVFGEGTPAEVAARRLTAEPSRVHELVPGVPEDIGEVLHRAVRLDPDDRYSDARAFAAALAGVAPAEATRVVAAAMADDAGTTSVLDRAAVVVDPTEIVVPAGPGRGDSTDGDPHTARGGRGTAPGPPPPAEQRTVVRAERSDRRSRNGAIVGVLVALLISAVAYVGLRGGTDDGGGGDVASTVTPIAADDFDPQSDANEEHGDEVGAAIDGDPATAWTTEGYDTPELGGLKEGVGLVLDLGEVHDVRAVTLQLDPARSDATIYVGADAPRGPDPEGWGTELGSFTDSGEEQVVEADEPVSGRYVLVWFTRLGGGDNRAGIAEATVELA